MSDPIPPAVSDAMREAVARDVAEWMAITPGRRARSLGEWLSRPAGPIASEIARLTELQQRTHGRLMNWEARAEAAEAETARLRAALEAVETPRPISEYHEDMGFVLWWILPVREPPYSGSPGCDDWPDYHTHFTPLPEIRDEDYRPKRTAQTFRDAPIDEHGYVDMSARAALSSQEQADAVSI